MAAPIVGNPVFAQTDSFLPGGTTIGVSINSPLEGAMFFVAPGGTVDVPVVGTADVGSGPPTQQTSIIYVIDASGSTTRPAETDTCGNQNPIDTTPGEDLPDNPDTFFPLDNEIIDCEILAVKNLNEQAIDLGTVLEVGVVGFAGIAAVADTVPGATDGVFIAPDADQDSSTMRDLDEVVMSMTTKNGGDPEPLSASAFNEFSLRDYFASNTNYGDAIDKAQTMIPSAQEGTTVIVVFISDGSSNTGIGVDAALNGGPSAVYHTFAVGPSNIVACSLGDNTEQGSLQELADQTGGTCTNVTDPAMLPEILPEVIMSSLDSLEIDVDSGGDSTIPNSEITPDLPQDGPIRNRKWN